MCARLELYNVPITRPKRVMRILLFASALFVGLNIAVALLPRIDYGTAFRLPSKDNALLMDHFTNYMNRESGKKVVFLGSSVIYGYGVDNTESVPYQFGRMAGRNYSVFNLGLDGGMMGDQYFLAKRLADNVDVFLIEVNPIYFTSSQAEKGPVQYDSILERVPLDKTDSDMTGFVPRPNHDVETKVNQFFRSLLPLVNRKEEVSAMMFEAGPKNRILWVARSFKNSFGDEWAEQPFFNRTDDDKRKSVGDYRIEYSMGQQAELPKGYVYYFNKTIELVKAKNKTIVVLVDKFNSNIVDTYQIFSEDAYRAHIMTLEAIAAANNVTFVDYNYRAGYEMVDTDYSDIFHYLASGSERYASWLYEDTKSLLRRLA